MTMSEVPINGSQIWNKTISPLSSNLQITEKSFNSKHPNEYLGKAWGLPPY